MTPIQFLSLRKSTRFQVLFLSMASIYSSIAFIQTSFLTASSKYTGSHAINAKFETWFTSSFCSYNSFKLLVLWPLTLFLTEANVGFDSLLIADHVPCRPPTLDGSPCSWVLGVLVGFLTIGVCGVDCPPCVPCSSSSLYPTKIHFWLLSSNFLLSSLGTCA